MKIFLDYSKLTDAPCSDRNKDSFDFDQANDSISNVSSEVIHGNPTCFIVSGYRGAGKTSFLRRVQDQVAKTATVAPIAFVEISLPEKIDTKMLLRRIIRRIYLSISDQDNAKNCLKNYEREILEELEDLYQRTFYEIGESAKRTQTKESAVEAKLTANMKKIVMTITLFVFAVLTAKFETLTWLLNLSKKNLFERITIDELIYSAPISYLLYIIYIFAKDSSLKITQSKKNKGLYESSIKRLYDDDIAEDHLWRTLGKISKTRLKLVFIIDELDKIEDDNDLQSLIRALKPLMLSGLASFILVTGQTLYYKFHSIHTSDDAILASLFSKSIHVPLLSVEQFRKLFSNMYISTEGASEDQIKKLVDSIILESNRIPRRFYALIRQKLCWEEAKAYIRLEQESEKIFETHSRLLAAIQFVEQDLIQPQCKEGIKDFFISQLHLMVQRMLASGGAPFSRKAVCETEKDKLTLSPEWYLPKLNKFADSLLDAYVNAGLLTEDVETTEKGDQEKVYSWTDQADAAVKLSEIDPRTVEFSFVKVFMDLERIAREVHVEMASKIGITSSKRKMPLQELLADLGELELLSKQTLEKLRPITKLRNRLVHEGPQESGDFKIAANYEETLIQMRHELLSKFTFELLARELKKIGYQLSTVDQYFDTIGQGFSFKATSLEKDKQRPDILFGIKFDLYFIANPEKSRDLMLRHMAKYKAATKKETAAIIFLYVQPGATKRNQIKVNNEYKDTRIDYTEQSVFIRIISESRYDKESDCLEEHFTEILTKIGINRSDVANEAYSASE
jgi:hypothetical protein